MKITFYGHATFLMEIQGERILIDPFMSGNPMCEAEPETMQCDYMLLSHGHQDHILDAVEIAKHTGCKVISNFEICGWLGKHGVDNTWSMNHGGTAKLGFGTVKYVNAVHSSVLPDGSNGGNPGGFVINGDGQEIYYAGDTALHMDMELLGRYSNLSLAILPIGDTFTMGYEDAAIAAQMIDCQKVIGMHYDTFPPIEIDHSDAKKAFEAKGKDLILMESGQTLEF
jgi:L-ascorbate metabolism protein UlaG (beta-lactamase superfamily)